MIRLIGPSKTNSSVGCGFTKPCSSENSSRNVSATYRRTRHRTTARHFNTSWLTSTRTSTGRNRRYWICLPNPEISSSSGTRISPSTPSSWLTPKGLPRFTSRIPKPTMRNSTSVADARGAWLRWRLR